MGSLLDEVRENIHKQCIISDTCFTSLEIIGSNLFTRYPKNLNHVNRYSNDILSVIIILGTNLYGDETVFYDGMNMNDIGTRAHVLNL